MMFRVTTVQGALATHLHENHSSFQCSSQLKKLIATPFMDAGFEGQQGRCYAFQQQQ
jgi:hypothetical protein